MKKFNCITSWIGTGTMEDPRRAKIVDDYPVSCRDITGQPSQNLPPEPNGVIFQVTCTDDIYADIERDNDYFILPGTTEDINDAETI